MGKKGKIGKKQSIQQQEQGEQSRPQQQQGGQSIPQQQQGEQSRPQQQQGGQSKQQQQQRRQLGLQQQQRRQSGLELQQGGQSGLELQQGGQSKQQQQQRRQSGLELQQGGQSTAQQQQGRQSGPQQQREGESRPQQQQGEQSRPQQQQGGQSKQQQHQRRQFGWQQQQRIQSEPQQQREGESRPQKQQGGQSTPQQQREGESRPQQQQGGQSTAQQQQGRQSGPQQQREGESRPQQQQGEQSRPQQQQGGQSKQQQHQRRQFGQQQQQRRQSGLELQQGGQSGLELQQGGQSKPQQQREGESRPQKQQGGQSRPQNQQGGQSRPEQQQGGQSRPEQQQGGQSRPEQQHREQPGPWGKKQEESERLPNAFAKTLNLQSQLHQHHKQQETTIAVRSQKSQLAPQLHNMYMKQIPKKNVSEQGKSGRKITVECNMFRLNIEANSTTFIIHYDVVIIPDKPKCLLRTVFEAYRKKHFPNRYPAFDGKKNAYCGTHLPFGEESKEDEIEIFDEEFQKERTFKVYLKQAATLDLSWLKSVNYGLVETFNQSASLQALEIILKHGPANKHISVGRSIFPKPEPGQAVSLSNGVHLWVGVFQSVILGSRPYLNMDVTNKRFAKPQSVISLMKELCQDRRSRTVPENISAHDVHMNQLKINKFLKGLKIQYELPGQRTTKRTYRVNELVKCPRENKFTLEDGTAFTVEEYFLKMKNYRIQFPLLPCVWVGSRNSNVHIPAELCTIVPGQLIQSQMDSEQTTAMIRAVVSDTRTRKDKIMKGFAKVDLNNQPILTNEFNISVHGEFEKVPARVLAPPSLKYHNQLNVKVSRGVWRANAFLRPCELPENKWTILNLDKYVVDRDLYCLHDKLLAGGKSLNMSINRAQTPFKNLAVQANITPIQNYFKEKKNEEIKLVVVIIPVMLDNAYSLVKQISELSIPGGIVTQCIKSSTLRKLSDSTIVNILLKINSKLNGINHTFAETDRPKCLNQPCMIMGADVTHPSPDAVDIPSIAAVAASHDPTAFQYNIEVRLQSPRQEMIQDMEEMAMCQLMFFYTKTGHKPKAIIFYRDGVSDGQLTHVMHFELQAIKRAIARLNRTTECNIPITYLVVQKRHHVRLFPTDPKNSYDKNFNVEAGTVVDTDITHPTHIDFYMVSHASIQGTARPTKYRCICNENEMSENQIEQLTYYLCHMFARCTRSVSYPAPTYYAHLGAFRARALIHNRRLNLNNLQEAQRINMNLEINKISPMFFV